MSEQEGHLSKIVSLLENKSNSHWSTVAAIFSALAAIFSAGVAYISFQNNNIHNKIIENEQHIRVFEKFSGLWDNLKRLKNFKYTLMEIKQYQKNKEDIIIIINDERNKNRILFNEAMYKINFDFLNHQNKNFEETTLNIINSFSLLIEYRENCLNHIESFIYLYGYHESLIHYLECDFSGKYDQKTIEGHNKSMGSSHKYNNNVRIIHKESIKTQEQYDKELEKLEQQLNKFQEKYLFQLHTIREKK